MKKAIREIKFRAKPTTGGYPWVYGNAVIQINGKAYLFEDTDGCAGVFDDGDTESSCYIVDGLLEVYPETVGQYTGLKSRDGKEIYEGDILERAVTGIPFEFEVVFHKGCFKARFGDSGFDDVVPLHVLDDQEIIQVIGNIHDNPELKEGKR